MPLCPLLQSKSCVLKSIPFILEHDGACSLCRLCHSEARHRTIVIMRHCLLVYMILYEPSIAIGFGSILVKPDICCIWSRNSFTYGLYFCHFMGKIMILEVLTNNTLWLCKVLLSLIQAHSWCSQDITIVWSFFCSEYKFNNNLLFFPPWWAILIILLLWDCCIFLRFACLALGVSSLSHRL